MEEIHRAIHDALLDACPKQVARLMGTSHTSLLNRANPNDDTHRLNVEQFLQILVHTQDMRPLHALAEQFGFELVAKEQPKAKQLTAALLHMGAEVADVTRITTDALADGHLNQIERASIVREVDGAIEALQVLRQSAKVA